MAFSENSRMTGKTFCQPNRPTSIPVDEESPEVAEWLKEQQMLALCRLMGVCQ